MDAQLVLAQRQWLATRDAQLPFHQVEARDGFGHRMFHLQAGVHLHEEKPHRRGAVITRLLDDEFHRASAHIVDSFGGGHGSLAHLLTQRIGHAGSRSFFQDLLVTALHRTIAFKQVNAVAVCVAKHLDFNVAWALHVFLDQHRVVAKAVHGFALATGQSFCKVRCLLNNAHALAATASAGFDEHGVTHAVSFTLQQGRVLVNAVVAGHQRHACFFHQLFGRRFEAHRLNGRCGRTNEHQARRGTGVGEVCVLTQKTVARVHRLCARVFGRLQDALPAQVAVFGCAAADVHGFVTHLHMLGDCVGV